MSMADQLPEEDELLAAELAFGLLDADDRRVAEARIDGDAAFADAHRRWQARAVALLSGHDEAPRPSVWPAIEARLPANDVGPGVASRATLRWWQGGASAASIAAVLLALIVVQRPPVPAPAAAVQSAASPPMVAVLTGAKSGVVTVSYDPNSGRLTSAPTGVDIGAHSPELWVIPADGKPRSLGIITAAAPSWTKAPRPAAVALAAGVTLAISVEPIGGSPTGQPTGPVILTGKMTST